MTTSRAHEASLRLDRPELKRLDWAFALSLALSPDFSGKGDYVLLPESRHEPLRQRAVLLKRSGDTARAFYRFLREPAARDVFVRYGYALPGD